uniref:DUF753 domain-containing protein n=1 Tax=Megaselia scalaris TaxID=36166 RepID=T1GCA8_MEGSC
MEKCVLCDSQKNPSCVANTNSSKTVDCKTACFSFINNVGDTVRGCAINDDICQNNELCSTCKTDLCNQEVFPESRLQCVQCENCFNSTTLPQMSYCDIYNPEDECYTYFDPKTLLTIRGCTSSSMPPMCGNCNLEKCQTDGCNNKQPEISNFFCYECYGSDEDCVSGKNLEAVRCAHGDRCITQYDNSTGNLWRSCVASKTEECSKEDEANGFCEICTKDKCNDQLMPSDRLYCLQCEGQNATNCYNGTVGSTPCLRAQKFDRCYSYIDHKDVMHRGCESDGFCDGSDQCVYCGKDGCNNVDGNGNPDLPNVGTFLVSLVMEMMLHVYWDQFQAILVSTETNV